jgi:Predicted aminoglycoside phosphotransferase
VTAFSARRFAASAILRGGEPETIVHGDFHPGNALIAEDGHAVILDWSDACIGHPSFDRHLFRSEHETAETIPASLHHAVSYREILARMEPDDRWRFETAPRHFLDQAVAALS